MIAPTIDTDKKQALLAYMRKAGSGVVSTTSAEHGPEAAFVNLAITDDLELIFETLNMSRKFHNLEIDPRIAVVIGGEGEKTVQLEGLARELFETELEELKAFYYVECPHNLSHRGWPGLTYVAVRPHWLRFSNYGMPWTVEEYSICDMASER